MYSFSLNISCGYGHISQNLSAVVSTPNRTLKLINFTSLWELVHFRVHIYIQKRQNDKLVMEKWHCHLTGPRTNLCFPPPFWKEMTVTVQPSLKCVWSLCTAHLEATLTVCLRFRVALSYAAVLKVSVCFQWTWLYEMLSGATGDVIWTASSWKQLQRCTHDKW